MGRFVLMISGLKFDAKILNRPNVTIINFFERAAGPRGAGPPGYRYKSDRAQIHHTSGFSLLSLPHAST
ncbi:MAG: hypothetical protein ACKVOQ_11275 [Cyclobacteriaceae bacterium]